MLWRARRLTRLLDTQRNDEVAEQLSDDGRLAGSRLADHQADIPGSLPDREFDLPADDRLGSTGTSNSAAICWMRAVLRTGLMRVIDTFTAAP